MKKYEYKTISIETSGFFGGDIKSNQYEEELNKMGQEGWELVNTFPIATTSGITIKIISVFKRIVT